MFHHDREARHGVLGESRDVSAHSASMFLMSRCFHVSNVNNGNKLVLSLELATVKLQTTNRITAAETAHGDVRSRILTVALKLLAARGPHALTTRAVAEAAGVQPPVLYRHFADKEAMLDALAEHGFLTYIAEKRRRAPEPDPVDVLRSGWDLHIAFGLAHPALYQLMYAHPRPGVTTSAAELSFSALRQHVRRIAAAGRLRVPEEQAVSLYHAASVGVVLVLLSAPAEQRDMAISHMARNAALAAIADAPSASGKHPEKTAAITLRAALGEESPFSAAELSLFKEWLGRLTTWLNRR